MLTKPSDRPSDDYFKEMLAELGGVEALRNDPNDFRKAVSRSSMPSPCRLSHTGRARARQKRSSVMRWSVWWVLLSMFGSPL